MSVFVNIASVCLHSNIYRYIC